MTPLRAKYIRDLVIRGRSKHTQEAYTRYVRDLARYYRRSPELISYEEVTDWLYHLIKERQLSASSVNIAVSSLLPVVHRHWAPIFSIVHTVSIDTGRLAPAATGIVRAAWPPKAGNG
jgi:hypothetical protein